jgi:hypothetical protein
VARLGNIVLLLSLLAVDAGQIANAASLESASEQVNPVAAEFNKRLAAVPIGDISQQLQLGDWAVAQGLLDEADALYRRVLKQKPHDERAYESLLELAGQRTLGNSSDTRKLARELLAPEFIEYQSKRFIVFTDRGGDVASRQLSLLERTHHQYLRFCQRLSLRPLPLEHKLVCILFSTAANFQHFGKEYDQVTDLQISGYYSPKHDWIVFYHAGGSQDAIRAHQDLNQLRAEIDDLGEQASQAALDGHHDDAQLIRSAARRSRVQIDQHRQQMNMYAEQRDTATIIHEAIHQLLFHTEVQSRTIQYPLWICEGLATSFETDTAQNAFGPDCDYAPRRRRFEELLASNSLLSVSELVSLEAVPHNKSDAMYQQSYALTTWLCRHRKIQMRAYLTELSTISANSLPANHIKLFEAHFGETQSLERTWLNYERTALATRNRTSASRK